MGKIFSGYIRTPAELDAAARALERSLWQTSSPQKRFLLITEFHSHTREIPASWMGSYIGFLAPVFIELVRAPYIRSFPPDVWVDAYDFLTLIHGQKWGGRLPGLENALQQAIEQVILSHAFVSSLRELHAFLLRHGVLDAPLTTNEWTRIFGASTTGFGLFTAYVEILRSRPHAQLAPFERAVRTWREFRDRTDAVSVILLEDEGYGKYSAGRVLLMDVVSQTGTRGDGHLSNLIGDSGHDTIEQIHRAEKLSSSIIRDRFGTGSGDARYVYSVHESSAQVIGGSLGLAVIAGLLAERTQRLNLPERWKLAPTVACTGSLEEDGTLLPGTWDSLEAKLRLAFHSPLEKIVIPSAHREAALFAVQMLQREYPNRMLETIGVSRVQDLPEVSGVFRVRTRGGLERVRETITRSSVFFVSVITIILLGGGGYLLYHAFYDYPNLELVRGLKVTGDAIVYNPNAEQTWCFRDGDELKAPLIPFGDLEVGDGFTRTLFLWNMTPTTSGVRLSIEGPDSLDWYVNSGDEVLHVPSAANVALSVMFAPLSAAAEKRARLVLRDQGNGATLYSLDLSGAAGPPRSAGYALRLDGVDDMLRFGRRSTAFDVTSTARRELTFECWFRPAQQHRNFILLYNGFAGQGDARVEDLILGMDSLHRVYYKIGSEIRFPELSARHRLRAGTWNHIALAVSLPKKRIMLALNGVVIEDYVTDFLMEGIAQPDVTIGARKLGKTPDMHFEGEIDEVRLWHEFRGINDIRAHMHHSLPASTERLAGYWTMDNAVESIVFNANQRAHSGELFHRPTLVRSDLPGWRMPEDCTPVLQSDGVRSGIALRAGRYLACMRPVLPRYGDASIALRFLQTALPAIHFYYAKRDEGWISIEEMYTYTRVGRNHVEIEEGWHDAVIRVTATGELYLSIDGVTVDTSRTCTEGPQDWHEKFEGFLLGFQFDKQNQLNTSFHNYFYPALSHERSFAGLHFWHRLLTDEEIREWSTEGVLPEDGMTASWDLDVCPGEDGNFVDRVGGALLHMKSVRTWR
ncbi:MAG: LamG-like jellyroll fold domain-containing protein [Bacteroidota bacterium]|nr:LamG-like jellyroll fold domain-containing protein [Bacteroidota bacterium]